MAIAHHSPVRVIIVGAGIGGLSAAIHLAVAGCEVTVIERSRSPGGKMRGLEVGGLAMDGGPTVLTMRWVLDDLCAAAGVRLGDHVTIEPNELLARHTWPDGSRLDLFADRERTVESIASFAGRDEAERYRAFALYAGKIYDAVEAPFLRSQRPDLGALLRHVGSRGLAAFSEIDAGRTMWRALGAFFRDPRLCQLFGRYATYCGASPFSAPATLNLIAHVEAQGVYRVRGGMRALASALVNVASELGVNFLFGAEVTGVVVSRGCASAVEVSACERFEADAVVLNADVSALAGRRFGISPAESVRQTASGRRSLSAVTWATISRAAGFPLVHHNVFFSADCVAEFGELFGRGRVPEAPTVYLCAQDRSEHDRPPEEERMLVIVNAPATGDDPSRWSEPEIQRCERAAMATLSSCGLQLTPRATVCTTPVDFDRSYPATGGALYGQRATGILSSMTRQGSRTSLRHLYLAGGSVHPGPGVPMAALSGKLAAESLLSDLASTRRSRRADTAGFTSTARATRARQAS